MSLQKIIEAGVFAPFPALGTDRRTSLRKFVVLRNGSTEWDMLKSILVTNGRLYAKLTKRQGLYRFINRLTPRSHRIGDHVIEQSDIYARMMVERGAISPIVYVAAMKRKRSGIIYPNFGTRMMVGIMGKKWFGRFMVKGLEHQVAKSK